jgi:prepilin-type N-terminal cleavage/methylation domain-containing protein
MSQTARDKGFTLIELLVTISLLGIMMAIAVSGWSSWSQARSQSGAARELLSVMRQAQQRAVTEGRATCVTFFPSQPRNYSVAAGACGTPTGTVVQGAVPGRVQLQSVGVGPDGTSVLGFKKPDASAQQTAVQFSSRGTGWPGSVTVRRTGSSSTFTLQVEVLTGHVALVHG